MTNAHHSTYQSIFYSCVEGIILVNKGKISLANPQCEQLFGYAPDELIGMQVEELMPSSVREDHLKNRKSFDDNPEPRQMGIGRDLIAQRKDGTLFPVEISLNVAKVNNEKVTIAHIIDISRRKETESQLKRSEEQLLKYAAELEQRVQERTRKLNKAIEDLQKTNTELEEQINERIKAENEARIALEREKELSELKTRFVSMASHEFRTPLSAVLSSVSLIGKYISDENKEQKLKHINRIKSSVGELTSILNDFLSMDKLDMGKFEAFPQKIVMCEFLNEIVDEMGQLTKKGQTIDLKCDHPETTFNTDPQILKQSLANLISNAIKYSPEDSVVTIKVDVNSNLLIIDVIDQGIGIPEADQKHLFDKFFRAHNASHIQGTGLGLNIVKKYLELIRGEINFESKEGVGSTFGLKIKPFDNE